MRKLMNRAHLAAVLAAGLFLTAACSWSVPADPGLNSQIRGRSDWALASVVATEPSAAAAEDPKAAFDAGTRDLYLRKCSQCHAPIHPTALPAAMWPAMVNKFGPRAGLFGEERRRVLAWLVANAQ